ncbi:MAG TPA: LolA-related protein [Burkholderiales bacterium]|nr:LolA-related protein [Burkholderiales bacterium]
MRLSLFALLLLATPGVWPAPVWTLEQLLQGFAQRAQARASFVEKKTVRVLEQPLVSSGELRFEAPDRLEKRTLRPRPEVLRLHGDTLTLERGERRLQLDLRSHPEAGAFVESIRATLAGDREALERIYAVRLEGSERSWALTLTPRDTGMANLVARIRIAGQGAEVTVIEIAQANGDSTLMSVQRLGAP